MYHHTQQLTPFNSWVAVHCMEEFIYLFPFCRTSWLLPVFYQWTLVYRFLCAYKLWNHLANA
jgi:hypothetical protein